VAFVGGGSLPGQTLPAAVVAVTAAGLSDAAIAERLRLGEPAVMARLHDGRVVVDVRTVFPEQDDALAAALLAACRGPA
jgi:L-seryl-tRNA(Ser) seleniumtransferase